MNRFIFSSVLIILIVFASLSLAGIPKMLNYQGMLTDNSGNPFSDTVSITFKIYDQSSGGNLKWQETQNNVPVVNGLFNVILGSVTPISLDFSEDYWLDITVGAEHMPSRLRFTSVGYAYRALVADSAAISGSGGGGWVDDGTVVRLETSDDSVGIGTDAPVTKLHVMGGGFQVSTSQIGGSGCRISGNEIAGTGVNTPGFNPLHIKPGDNSSNILLAEDGGKVGIGTTNPEAKFHSEGSWILGITNSILPVHWGYGFDGWLTSDKGIRYEGAGDSIAHLFTTYGTGNIAEFGKSSGQGQEVNTQLVITNNGNVGIGTTSPGSFKLAVNGTAAKPGGGSWSVFSDARLKDVRAEYRYGLSEISRLNPVRYRYKQDNEVGLPSEKEFVGLVAQEVQKFIPEAIEKDEKGYLLINNDPIIWAMLNAIKELKSENEELKKRIEMLECR